jgi:hypothetical protein
MLATRAASGLSANVSAAAVAIVYSSGAARLPAAISMAASLLPLVRMLRVVSTSNTATDAVLPSR